MNGNKELSQRETFLQKTSVDTSFRQMTVFWADFRHSLRGTKFPRAPILNIGDLVKIQNICGCELRLWIIVHFCNGIFRAERRMICNFAEQILGTSPLRLHRHWADWRKEWCVVATLPSMGPRCNESMSFHLLYFSKLQERNHLFLWLQDDAFSKCEHYQFSDVRERSVMTSVLWETCWHM